jgi:hypothetical protein
MASAAKTLEWASTIENLMKPIFHIKEVLIGLHISTENRSHVFLHLALGLLPIPNQKLLPWYNYKISSHSILPLYESNPHFQNSKMLFIIWRMYNLNSIKNIFLFDRQYVGIA